MGDLCLHTAEVTGSSPVAPTRSRRIVAGGRSHSGAWGCPASGASETVAAWSSVDGAFWPTKRDCCRDASP